MDRRDFVRKSCAMCLGGGIFSITLSGCVSTKYVTGIVQPDGLSVLKSEFTYRKKDQLMTRPYIIVQNDKLEFPIYLYRLSDSEYSALWMKCAHQGAELQASGDHLHCPSHGSEYNNYGIVTQGPAEKNLRSFAVLVVADKILIDLRLR